MKWRFPARSVGFFVLQLAVLRSMHAVLARRVQPDVRYLGMLLGIFEAAIWVEKGLDVLRARRLASVATIVIKSSVRLHSALVQFSIFTLPVPMQFRFLPTTLDFSTPS
jgi:hypothetical protein